MEIKFFDEKIPSDKTEKTTKDVFKTAGQIMFNYYRLALKKDIRRLKAKYIITLSQGGRGEGEGLKK